MNYRHFYIGKLPNEPWKNVFIFCLNKSNRFKVHLHENIKTQDQGFYADLKSTQKLDIKPWPGCKDFIEISGVIDEKTKSFFKKYLYQSLNEDGEELWDYQFLYDHRQVLYVGDHTDRLVLFSEKELEEIRQQEISFDMWTEHEVCLEMLDERNISNEDIDDFSFDVNSISEAVTSFFNKLESTLEEK